MFLRFVLEHHRVTVSHHVVSTMHKYVISLNFVWERPLLAMQIVLNTRKKDCREVVSAIWKNYHFVLYAALQDMATVSLNAQNPPIEIIHHL